MTSIEISSDLLRRAAKALKREYCFFDVRCSSAIMPAVVAAEDRSVMVTNGAYLYAALAGEHFPADWFEVPKEDLPDRKVRGLVSVPFNKGWCKHIDTGAFDATIRHSLEVPDDSRVPPCIFNYRYGMLAIEQLGAGPWGDNGVPLGDFYRAQDGLSFGWKATQRFVASGIDYHVYVVIAGIIIK